MIECHLTPRSPCLHYSLINMISLCCFFPKITGAHIVKRGIYFFSEQMYIVRLYCCEFTSYRFFLSLQGMFIGSYFVTACVFTYVVLKHHFPFPCRDNCSLIHTYMSNTCFNFNPPTCHLYKGFIQ